MGNQHSYTTQKKEQFQNFVGQLQRKKPRQSEKENFNSSNCNKLQPKQPISIQSLMTTQSTNKSTTRIQNETDLSFESNPFFRMKQKKNRSQYKLLSNNDNIINSENIFQHQQSTISPKEDRIKQQRIKIDEEPTFQFNNKGTPIFNNIKKKQDLSEEQFALQFLMQNCTQTQSRTHQLDNFNFSSIYNSEEKKSVVEINEIPNPGTAHFNMPLFRQPEEIKKKYYHEKAFRIPEDDTIQKINQQNSSFRKDNSLSYLRDSIDHLQQCNSKSANTSFQSSQQKNLSRSQSQHSSIPMQKDVTSSRHYKFYPEEEWLQKSKLQNEKGDFESKMINCILDADIPKFSLNESFLENEQAQKYNLPRRIEELSFKNKNNRIKQAQFNKNNQIVIENLQNIDQEWDKIFGQQENVVEIRQNYSQTKNNTNRRNWKIQQKQI